MLLSGKFLNGWRGKGVEAVQKGPKARQVRFGVYECGSGSGRRVDWTGMAAVRQGKVRKER